jgi:primosomal replication protein N
MYLNKAIIIGNLTRDPETKALPSGIKVTTLSVATNRVWKDKSGARQESTDYHNVVVFGRQAETTSQYLKKGSSLLVEGRLQTRSWDGNSDLAMGGVGGDGTAWASNEVGISLSQCSRKGNKVEVLPSINVPCRSNE